VNTIYNKCWLCRFIINVAVPRRALCHNKIVLIRWLQSLWDSSDLSMNILCTGIQKWTSCMHKCRRKADTDFTICDSHKLYLIFNETIYDIIYKSGLWIAISLYRAELNVISALNSFIMFWQLKEIRSLLVAGTADVIDFVAQLKLLEMGLQSSIKDLRSQVVREACITVAWVYNSPSFNLPIAS